MPVDNLRLPPACHSPSVKTLSKSGAITRAYTPTGPGRGPACALRTRSPRTPAFLAWTHTSQTRAHRSATWAPAHQLAPTAPQQAQ